MELKSLVRARHGLGIRGRMIDYPHKANIPIPLTIWPSHLSATQAYGDTLSHERIL